MATDILTLEGVVAGYGKLVVLNETTFSVPRGAISTIIGPNGAGKSTVFKAVFGSLAVQRGRITFDGRDINGYQPWRLLELGLCYVPQGRNVFPELSVRHNLEFGLAASCTRADAAARIEAVMAQFPMLREKAGAQASTLSGGQQKQLEIARGLLREPKLMLIDEPSIGLAPVLVQQTFALLRELASRGVTILMVEQNAKRALEISDHGIVLELGRARMTGRAEELLQDRRVSELFLGGSLSPG